MKAFTVRLVKDLYKQLQEESKKTGLSMNTIIVLALQEYLKGD